MGIEAVIFDMDGLLFDTEATGRWAWDKSLESHGYAMTDDIYMQFVGRDMSHREYVLKMHFGLDFPFESVKALRILLGDSREIESGLKIKPGAVQLLAAFSKLGIPIGLATGTVRDRTLRRLQGAGIRNYFRAIVAGDEVHRGKPFPDVYFEASQRLGISPQKCIVFEDSCAGVQAAMAAGMRVVMVPDLERPTPDIKNMAYCILPSLIEAIERLPKLMGKATVND